MSLRRDGVGGRDARTTRTRDTGTAHDPLAPHATPCAEPVTLVGLVAAREKSHGFQKHERFSVILPFLFVLYFLCGLTPGISKGKLSIMPTRTTPFASGGYYHIYNRGANKVSLFHAEHNYHFVLRLMKRYCKELQISVVAYCLMPNHYHWLVRQDGEAPAGLLPQRVFNVYSHALHTYEGHSGTLFEGRYKAIKVDQEEYLRHLCRYIHINPVRHRFVSEVSLWPYSNYPEWIGARSGTLVDKEFIATFFATADNYKIYLESYLAGQSVSPKGLAGYLLNLDGLSS